MIRGIIFDVYGTLISTGTGSIDATKKILDKINVDMDPKEFYGKWKEFHKKQILEMKDFITEKEIFYNDLKMLYEYYGLEGNYKEDVKFMLDTQGKRKSFTETNEVLHNYLRSIKTI